MVGSRDDQTVRVILFDHLEEAVEYPPNFADIVVQSAGRSDAVEFIEQISSARLVEGFKYQTKFSGCFAHEFSDEAIETNNEKR